jgi:hypothetical protein
MKAKLIKVLDNGWPIYYLKRDYGKTIATTRFPFDGPAIMIAKNAAIELQKISHVKCGELFGIVDVEKLADELYNGHAMAVDWQLEKSGFKTGFNKAMELNKDKVFTIEDIKRAFIAGSNFTSPDEVVLNKTFGESMISLIKSLQQPTEIEVEIEMEVADLAFYENGERHPIEADLPERFKYKPKLDSEGCLILKKI